MGEGDWHLACTRQVVPYALRDLVRVPSPISLLRLPLAVAFAWAIERAWWPVGILVIAGLSDVLDGWYARHFGQTTKTGAVLDAVMDKVFVTIVVVVRLGCSRRARSAVVGSAALEALVLATAATGVLAIGAYWRHERERITTSTARMN